MPKDQAPTTEQRIERMESMIEDLHLAFSRQIIEGKRDATELRDQLQREEQREQERAAEKPRRERLMAEFMAERCTVGPKHRCMVDAFATTWDNWMRARAGDLYPRMGYSTVRDEFLALSGATECAVLDDRSIEKPGLSGISIVPQHRELPDIENPGDDATAVNIMRRRHGKPELVGTR